MMKPENKISVDDSLPSEADDQQSQKDIHNNGLDEDLSATDQEEEADESMLNQAYDAAEPSYTLNLDETKPDKED